MSSDVSQKYELVVGLEIHAQLATASKIFCSDPAHFGGEPNHHTSIISVGLPGTLPKLNEKVVEYAIRMGLATNCRVNKYNRFDRKNYFYADLPKGYQITQDEYPICKDGYLDIRQKDGNAVRIRINRIHMEEDAGKSIHDQDDNTLVDLNRAGVPLIEIVSEPDIRSAEQAAAYFAEIRKLVRYLDVCDGNLEEGSMRCDANISVRLKGAREYGNRCEVKNLNSLRNLQKAIQYEFNRQVQILEQGGFIEQNTLSFDPESGATSVLRSKEMAFDYRYFPEPDLQPLCLSDDFINRIKEELPTLPAARYERYTGELGLSDYDAELLSGDRDTAEYFENIIAGSPHMKAAANWLNGPIQAWLNEHAVTLSEFVLKPHVISELINTIAAGAISHTAATQQLFPALIKTPQSSIAQLISDLNLAIDTDSAELEGIVDEILGSLPEKVKEYHKGKKGVLGLFMGELMKRTRGKIDPREANKLMLGKLEKLK